MNTKLLLTAGVLAIVATALVIVQQAKPERALPPAEMTKPVTEPQVIQQSGVPGWTTYTSRIWCFQFSYPSTWTPLDSDNLILPWVTSVRSLASQQHFSVRVPVPVEAFIYIGQVVDSLVVDDEAVRGYLFPRGYESYGDVEETMATLYVPLENAGVFYVLQAYYPTAATLPSPYDLILRSFQFLPDCTVSARPVNPSYFHTPSVLTT